MKFSFWEKVGGSVLLTGWLLFVGNMAGNELVHPNEVAHAPEAEGKAAASHDKAAETAPAVKVDVLALLASADTGAGAKVFNKCKSCHSGEQGGKHKVGPNLWEIVGRPRAAAEGFSYSGAMKDAGGHWGYAELDTFLTSPKDAVPGTKMSFKGVSDPTQRAQLIVFLRSLSANPLPLP